MNPSDWPADWFRYETANEKMRRLRDRHPKTRKAGRFWSLTELLTQYGDAFVLGDATRRSGVDQPAEPIVKADVGVGKHLTQAQPDVATLRVTLPCYEDGQIYAPPEQVLEVCVIGPLAFLDTCQYEETNSKSTATVQSKVMVDAWALLRALALQLGVSELIVSRSSGAPQ